MTLAALCFRLLRLTFVAIICAIVAGCTVNRPPSVSCTALDSAAPSSFLPETARLVSADEIAAELAANAITEALAETRSGPVTLDVLTLSSGGQYGAFGAGFLRGWSENSATPRPEFDLVTGVSAGALIAAVPFAGPQFDSQLDVYRGITQTDVYNNNPPFLIPFSPAAASSEPLKALLQRQLNDDLIGQIARRHRQDGARLLVSAVNLDTTENRVFDLGDIANAAAPIQTRRDCLVEALMASGAVPALFPPRHIDGALYADGGLRDHVFFQALESERAAAARRTGRDILVHATIIVNGSLVPADVPVADNFPGYLGRSAEILADEVLRDSVVEAIAFAESREGWTIQGIIADVDISACGAGTAAGTVDSCVTQILFDHGRDVARGVPIAWQDADALRDKANEL